MAPTPVPPRAVSAVPCVAGAPGVAAIIPMNGRPSAPALPGVVARNSGCPRRSMHGFRAESGMLVHRPAQGWTPDAVPALRRNLRREQDGHVWRAPDRAGGHDEVGDLALKAWVLSAIAATGQAAGRKNPSAATKAAQNQFDPAGTSRCSGPAPLPNLAQSRRFAPVTPRCGHMRAGIGIFRTCREAAHHRMPIHGRTHRTPLDTWPGGTPRSWTRLPLLSGPAP